MGDSELLRSQEARLPLASRRVLGFALDEHHDAHLA